MEYRNLGNTGMKVSVAGLGCNNFGMRIDAKASAEVVHAALDAGVNFFDTALSYGGGQSEVFLGQALGPRRGDAVIATKFGSPRGEPRQGPWGAGSRRWILEAVELSLRSLGTDYIDLYQLHFVDSSTPIEETLSALNTLVTQGKVRYIGCSNFAGWQLLDAHWIAKTNGSEPFVTLQNEWSLLKRTLEAEVLPACRRTGTSILPYFPLASGILTGRYKRGETAPEGSRMSLDWFKHFATDEAFDRVEKLEKWAEQRGRSVTETSLSWLASQPEVASVIAGASRPDQVTENAAATKTDLTPTDVAELGELLI
jgi:aryl-alcohol dehydrogenase-like predicted oxidoreductase